MKGFAKYFFLVWATGIGVMTVFAFSTGHQDWQSEREESLSRVRQLSTSLRISLENLTEKTANDLTRIIEVELVSSGITHWLSESSFRSIAMVGKDRNGRWAVDWVKSKTPGNLRNQFQAWLPSLPLERIRGETLSWSSVVLTNERPMLLIGVQLKVKAKQGESYKVALGLLPLNYLASLTDPLKTEGEEVFLVDSAGKALTFPDPAYIGGQMEVHSIVAALKKSRKLSDFGNFRTLGDEPTAGGYEKAKNSNLYVITNQKIVSRQMAILGVFESGIMGFGLIILISLVVAFFARRDAARLKQMKKLIRRGATDPSASKEKASASDIERERRELFEQLGLTFLTQLRGPIYSSLGKIHRLSSSIKDAEGKKDIGFIETEVRRLRDFTEGLGQAFDLDSRPSERVDVSMIAEAQLSGFRKTLQKREIEVEFTPHANSIVRMSRDDLIFIMNTVYTFACHKLSYSGENRRLQVKVDRVGGMSRVSLLMVGAKFPVKEVETLFQIRDREQMDLSFARGFALSWNGNLSAESSVLGARMHLEFPALDIETSAEVKEKEEVKAEAVPAPPEEPLATQVTELKDDDLVDRKVNEELDKVLPPTPRPNQKTEVSVVDDLTATASSLNLNPETVIQKSDEKKEEDPMQVKIRKPKVRFDV